MHCYSRLCLDLHEGFVTVIFLPCAGRIQILSKPFDVITQELLERRNRRRLIGFIGAAAGAAPLTGFYRHSFRIHFGVK